MVRSPSILRHIFFDLICRTLRRRESIIWLPLLSPNLLYRWIEELFFSSAIALLLNTDSCEWGDESPFQALWDNLIAIKSHGSQDVEGDRIQTTAVVESNPAVQVNLYFLFRSWEGDQIYAVLVWKHKSVHNLTPSPQVDFHLIHQFSGERRYSGGQGGGEGAGLRGRWNWAVKMTFCQKKGNLKHVFA